MISEIFIALFKAGLPVGLAAYFLVWWALRNGYLSDVGTVKEIEKEVKRLKKDKESKPDGDIVHRKWLAMGGGFYGVVAVLTWVFIELGEILDFITSFDSIDALIASLSVGTLINMVIEAIKNSFLAIAWPVYWLTDIRSNHAWIWLVVAYTAYWAGSTLAVRQFADRGQDSDS
jgi:predicted tellurium resistance membrane protein TerC